MHQHAMWRAVEANRDRQAEPGLRAFEHPVQGRSQFEPELRPHQIDHIVAQRSAGRLQEAAGMIRHVQDPVRRIDQDAGRRDFFDGLAVQRGFIEQGGRGYGLQWIGDLSVQRAHAGEQARQQPQVAWIGR